MLLIFFDSLTYLAEFCRLTPKFVLKFDSLKDRIKSDLFWEKLLLKSLMLVKFSIVPLTVVGAVKNENSDTLSETEPFVVFNWSKLKEKLVMLVRLLRMKEKFLTVLLLELKANILFCPNLVKESLLQLLKFPLKFISMKQETKIVELVTLPPSV